MGGEGPGRILSQDDESGFGCKGFDRKQGWLAPANKLRRKLGQTKMVSRKRQLQKLQKDCRPAPEASFSYIPKRRSKEGDSTVYTLSLAEERLEEMAKLNQSYSIHAGWILADPLSTLLVDINQPDTDVDLQQAQFKQLQCLATSTPLASPYVAIGFKGSPPIIFDIKKKRVHFQAKKPPISKLGLVVPINVTKVAMVVRLAGKMNHVEPTILIAGTSNGTLWIYNLDANIDCAQYDVAHSFSKSPINLLYVDGQERLYVGDVTGKFEVFQFVSQSGTKVYALKSLGGFKRNSSGTVIDVKSIANDQAIITIDSDRYIRLYTTKERKLLHQLYLTNIPTCMAVVCEEGKGEERERDPLALAKTSMRNEPRKETDQSDLLWDNLEPIGYDEQTNDEETVGDVDNEDSVKLEIPGRIRKYRHGRKKARRN